MFYPMVEIKTNIVFNHQRMTLLNKSLQYALYHKLKSWITTLAFEAKKAVFTKKNS
jgi:hypothetical protein